jgi:hypothetical protein
MNQDMFATDGVFQIPDMQSMNGDKDIIDKPLTGKPSEQSWSRESCLRDLGWTLISLISRITKQSQSPKEATDRDHLTYIPSRAFHLRGYHRFIAANIKTFTVLAAGLALTSNMLATAHDLFDVSAGCREYAPSPSTASACS